MPVVYSTLVLKRHLIHRPLAREEKGQGGKKDMGTKGVDGPNRGWLWEGERKTMIAFLRILKDKNYACQF